MNTLRIYTIRDCKAEAYMAPFTFRNDGEAIRAFDDSIQKPGTPLHDHPEDFTLFKVGSFNLETGAVEAMAPICLGNAKDFVKGDK